MTKYAVYQYGYAVWGTGLTEEDAVSDAIANGAEINGELGDVIYSFASSWLSSNLVMICHVSLALMNRSLVCMIRMSFQTHLIYRLNRQERN